jgi:peptidoglycan hydrolase CwlO-like protein
MDKYLPGLVNTLMGLSVAGIVALVRLWQRLSLVESGLAKLEAKQESDMKDAKEEIKECKQSLSELARTMHQIELQAVQVQERFVQIAELSKQIQTDIRRSMERQHP